MVSAQRLVARQGDTLDQLLWREAGLGPGKITPVLDANPGLADLGSILPLGTVVIVPASEEAATTRTLPLIQLWS
ncbi:tail protein X [Sphingobium abikonense]|uniref:tail protein X n=1 Tax=Sphingobium abikonense TaxID=86193 RepID=UPI000787BCB9|nr:tail protein X [Sphingobium abikonense]